MAITTKKTLLFLLSVTFLFSMAFAVDWQEGTSQEDAELLNTPHKCSYDEQEKEEPEFHDVQEDLDADHEGRTLASYPKLRTYGYYGLLSSSSSAYRNYLQNDLMPPILDYFGAALRNKYPVSGKLKITTSSICSTSTPSVLKNGVDADFVLMVKGEDSSTLGWVANSVSCFLATGSKRPLVGRVRINRHFLKETTNVLLHEKNMMCIMHEVIHILGFASNMYKYFKGATITSAPLGSGTSKIVSAEPLTTKLRDHFGCSSLKGAYMENSGSSGTAGSHFERRQYAHEIMTSGLIYEMQMSELTLALLESSGWYAADYSYADQYSWGKGQGCSFLTGSCSSSSFSEFCSGSTRGCTVNGLAGGSCSSDTRSDGCKFIHPNINYHCENPDAESYARLPSIQTFGRTAGSKCFTGSLSSTSSTSQTSFCFKYSCSGSGTSTQLTLHIGSKSATCTKKGSVTVSGYKGSVNCPDPLEFCSTVGKKVCPRGCMGRGNCNNGVCSCFAGYKGKDCALNA